MVFLSLPGVPEVKSVCDQMVQIRGGSCIIDLSTTTVALARELHQRFVERADFADAPVARTRGCAERHALGDGGRKRAGIRTHPAAARPYRRGDRCGAAGAGQATKLINNMVLFQNVVALAEALTLARKSAWTRDACSRRLPRARPTASRCAITG